MQRVLVIIVTYNGEKWIERCLTSVDPDKGIDGIVIDNGSTDETLSIIRQKFPYVRIIETGKNLWFGPANNIGLRHAIKENYDYVYLLNQDAWIKPSDLITLININEKNPEYGIISGVQVYDGGEIIDPDFNYALSKELIDDSVLNNNLKEIYFTDKLMPAAHWLVKTEVIKKIGGFSPAFIHYGEDDNLFLRNQYWGYKAGIVPSIKVVHDREQRDKGKSYRLKLFNGGLRNFLSNPYPNQFSLFRFSKSVIRNVKKTPKESLKILWSVFSDYPQIKKAQKESRKEGAFL